MIFISRWIFLRLSSSSCVLSMIFIATWNIIKIWILQCPKWYKQGMQHIIHPRDQYRITGEHLGPGPVLETVPVHAGKTQASNILPWGLRKLIPSTWPNGKQRLLYKYGVFLSHILTPGLRTSLAFYIYTVVPLLVSTLNRGHPLYYGRKCLALLTINAFTCPSRQRPSL